MSFASHPFMLRPACHPCRSYLGKVMSSIQVPVMTQPIRKPSIPFTSVRNFAKPILVHITLRIGCISRFSSNTLLYAYCEFHCLPFVMYQSSSCLLGTSLATYKIPWVLDEGVRFRSDRVLGRNCVHETL